MTLSIIKQKQEDCDAHFLILAPKAMIKTAWLEDSRDFFPDLRILPLSNIFYFDDCRLIYERWRKYTKIPDKYRVTEADWDKEYLKIDYENDPNWEEKYNAKWSMQNHIWDCMVELADHYIVNMEKFRYDTHEINDNYVIDSLVVDESAILKNPQSKSA